MTRYNRGLCLQLTLIKIHETIQQEKITSITGLIFLTVKSHTLTFIPFNGYKLWPERVEDEQMFNIFAPKVLKDVATAQKTQKAQ